MGSQELTRPAAGAVATQQSNSLGTLQGLLEKYKHQIEVALPRHMTPERMIRVALSAVSSSPGLLECDPISVAACVVQSSILGLEPNSVLGESYLVPFWNGRLKRKQAQLVPGYQGLIKLARQSGDVSMIDAQIVYQNDEFEFHKGSEVWWKHKWARSGDRGEPEGVWAGYVLKDSSRNFEYWTLEQIEKHRDKFSKGAFDREGHLTGAWRDAPEWMWKKTVLRQIIKLMPKSIELASALSLEERSDSGLTQVFDSIPAELQPDVEDGPELPKAPAQPKRKSEAAKPPADGFELEGVSQ